MKGCYLQFEHTFIQIEAISLISYCNDERVSETKTNFKIEHGKMEQNLITESMLVCQLLLINLPKQFPSHYESSATFYWISSLISLNCHCVRLPRFTQCKIISDLHPTSANSLEEQLNDDYIF